MILNCQLTVLGVATLSANTDFRLFLTRLFISIETLLVLVRINSKITHGHWTSFYKCRLRLVAFPWLNTNIKKNKNTKNSE